MVTLEKDPVRWAREILGVKSTGGGEDRIAAWNSLSDLDFAPGRLELTAIRILMTGAGQTAGENALDLLTPGHRQAEKRQAVLRGLAALPDLSFENRQLEYDRLKAEASGDPWLLRRVGRCHGRLDLGAEQLKPYAHAPGELAHCQLECSVENVQIGEVGIVNTAGDAGAVVTMESICNPCQQDLELVTTTLKSTPSSAFDREEDLSAKRNSYGHPSSRQVLTRDSLAPVGYTSTNRILTFMYIVILGLALLAALLKVNGLSRPQLPPDRVPRDQHSNPFPFSR